MFSPRKSQVKIDCVIKVLRKMNRKVKIAEIDKCIISRLWYTAWRILWNEVDTICEDYTEDEILQLKCLIQSDTTDRGLQSKYGDQWIIWKILNVLNAKNIEIKANHIEFMSTLKFTKKTIADDVENELSTLFDNVSNSKNITENVHLLSSSTMKFLTECLEESSSLACSVIKTLLCIWSPFFHHSDDELQNVFVTCLQRMVGFQDLVTDTVTDALAPKSNCHSSSNKPKFPDKILGAILNILANIELTAVKQDELLARLYPEFLRFSHDIDVELALYARRNDEYLKEWYIHQIDVLGRNQSPNSLENASQISNALLEYGDQDSVGINSRELVSRTIGRRIHWIYDLLNICGVMITGEQYAKVEPLLLVPVVRRIRPVVLFTILNNFFDGPEGGNAEWNIEVESCDGLRFILDHCDIFPVNEITWNELVGTLRNHLDVTEWIMKNKKHFSTKEHIGDGRKEFWVKYILTSLQTDDVLAVLNATSEIHDKDFHEIKHLSQHSESTISFRAYYSTLNALKAILASTLSSTESFRVENYLAEINTTLHDLMPLSIRLETMRNIFSMLFLRHEDFHTTSINSEGSQDESDDSYNEKKYSESNSKQDRYGRSGFICNKLVLRSLLHLLEMIVMQTKDELQHIHDETELREDIEKSIDELSVAITDGKWRLELLTSSEFLRYTDSNVSDVLEHNDKNQFADILEKKPKFSERHAQKSSLYHQDGSSSEDDVDKSEVDFGSDLGSAETTISNIGTRRKHVKKSNQEKNARSDSNYSLIVNSMLSSQESLIIECVWKCDFDKAERAIKVFQLSESQLDNEVRFAKAIDEFRRKIQGNPDISSPRENNDNSENMTTLQSIRHAVEEGIQTSRLKSQLETFLASNKSLARLMHVKENNTNEILIMAILDLALTTGQCRSTSVITSEMAKKYLKSSKVVEKTPYSTYFSKIRRLFYESKLDASLPNVICNADVPMSSAGSIEKSRFIAGLGKVINLIKKTRAERWKSSETSQRTNLMTSVKNFEKILNSSSSEAHLRKVFAHLKILETISPDDPDENINGSPFAMLELSIHIYFGHQFFESGVEPEVLDAVAKTLHANLVHSILVNYCPKFPFRPLIEKIDSIKEDTTSCYYILNDISVDHNASKIDANISHHFVADILTELLSCISHLHQNKSTLQSKDFANLSRNADIRRILSKTSMLSDISLCELSVGDETLAFFLNLWNLEFLHALLTIWWVNTPYNELQHRISAMTIGYRVGELGLVTLATLRSKLLGDLAWDSELYKKTEEFNQSVWQDLDLVQDPRLVFAMANEFYGTPVIRVYDPQTLNGELDVTIRSYIGHYHVIEDGKSGQTDTSTDTCWLPQLVRRYQDFVLQNASMMHQTSGTASVEAFTLREFLNLNENKVDFNYWPQSYHYELKLYYSTNKHAPVNSDAVQRDSKHLVTTYGNKIMEHGVLQYFERHCWLISYLVQKVYKETSTTLSEISDDWRRCACMENLLQATWAQKLKIISHQNQALAAMHENISPKELWGSLENLLKKEHWDVCLDVIDSLSDNLLINNTEIICLRDLVLSGLISETVTYDARLKRLLRQMTCVRVLADTILFNVQNWSIDLCQNALTYVLSRPDTPDLSLECQERLEDALCRVMAFHKMLPHLSNNLEIVQTNWYAVAYGTNRTEARKIIKSLIGANKFELCLEWPKTHIFSIEMQSLVTEDLLMGLLEIDQQDFEPATKLLQALPVRQSIELCGAVLNKLESIDTMRFTTKFLFNHCKSTEIIKYQKISLGIEILTCLDSKERSSFVHLLSEPLLMLEQLLMNGKFKVLQVILNVISESLYKSNLSREDIDQIVRYYAGKSLDFRVALQRETIEAKSRDFNSSISELDNIEFTMPVKVPTKDEWVPNDKSRVCSCCKSVVFSMFNRRHHCRRCGRVVCAVCSQQRMRVPTYPDTVHVRVCNDCKLVTALRAQQQYEAPSTPNSEAFDYWRLTTDQSHNQTVKDEFSYEHAPSISLCLAILNLHSDHEKYASFLLDRCDEIKKLLRPVASGRINPEVDHTLLIKMIRSLLVAAKVKCAKLSLNADLNHCDRLLSYVDLVTTLVQSDCSALIPSEDLVEHTLRKLRDLLTEKEQWILALDVSTKSGLDRQGVWAAWGKAYLKVGCFEQARSKFAHCLEKVSSDPFGDWMFVSHSKETGEVFEISKNVKCNDRHKSREKMRPAKNPPLLIEILLILENLTNAKLPQSSAALTSFRSNHISVRLNNIKAISQGRYNELESPSTAGSANYDESLYYLISYGSHSAILEFFVKNQKYDESLRYILDNAVDPELFFDSVYLPCLRNGHIEKLHEVMKMKDATLILWKNYLVYTCHNLETKQFLNSLYELQIFMKDYVRASMSCIRFYTHAATDYTDLSTRSKYLIDAQKHLEVEMQAQSFGQSRRKSVSSQQSGHSCLTMELELPEIDKHINTISRQMEIGKFLRNGEQEGRNARNLLQQFLSMDVPTTQELPTLFGTRTQKTQLAILAILCGRDVEEGFGMAFRIIQDYNLRSEKVYSLAGHVLATEGKIHCVEQLVKCCRSSGAPDSNVLSDRVLAHCIKVLLQSNEIDQNSANKNKVDALIKLITDIELRISMCIKSKQLKAAYLLAVRHSRAQDVRKVLKEADRLEQNAIKVICAKWLQKAQRSQDRS